MTAEKRDSEKFLDPQVVSRLSNMAIRARLIVEGFIAGIHRSPYHGFSAEFSEYRRYIPGESTRQIDWKLFARTDRYYVRVFEDETNLRCSVIIDRSNSMGFGSTGITKLEYAALLGAALSYLMIRQRDAVGLTLFDETIKLMTPHRSVRSHLHHILRELGGVDPGAGTGIAASLGQVAERISRRGLVVVISDLMDTPSDVIGALRRFRVRGHETLVFHVLDPGELSLDYRDEVRFEDMETGETIRAQPWFLKQEYRSRIRDWTRQLEIDCRESGIDYNLLSLESRFDEALIAYLNKRKKMN
jgi:uncharacterized protein (DUF58 family)